MVAVDCVHLLLFALVCGCLMDACVYLSLLVVPIRCHVCVCLFSLGVARPSVPCACECELFVVRCWSGQHKHVLACSFLLLIGHACYCLSAFGSVCLCFR